MQLTLCLAKMQISAKNSDMVYTTKVVVVTKYSNILLLLFEFCHVYSGATMPSSPLESTSPLFDTENGVTYLLLHSFRTPKAASNGRNLDSHCNF